MKKLLPNRNSGFTIIEVMIVLAIAALILVVVLVAIPQLQQSQRNTARQDVTSRVLTELSNYAGNNNGQYPEDGTELADFETRYLANTSFEDPLTGENYELQFANIAPAFEPGGGAPAEMGYNIGSECDGESVVGTTAAGDRQIALIVELEPGNVFFCVDNQ